MKHLNLNIIINDKFTEFTYTFMSVLCVCVCVRLILNGMTGFYFIYAKGTMNMTHNVDFKRMIIDFLHH